MADIEIIKDNRKQVLDQLDELVEKALTECGLVASGHAQRNLTRNHSVDTGLLRNSITFAISGQSPEMSSYKADKGGRTGTYNGTQGRRDEKTVYIGTNVEYAPYVEFGTGQGAMQGMGGNQTMVGRSPKPYLKPAFSENVDEYEKILRKELGGMK